MDLKDDVLQFLELLWRLLFCQNGDSNVATQFVGNSHVQMKLVSVEVLISEDEQW